MLTPATIYAEAVRVLPPQDIDHHASDLYLRVTPQSRELIARFQFSHMVKTFIDNIDHAQWFDLPFCYIPA